MFDEVMGSSYMRNLSSRQKADLLLKILSFSSATSPTDSAPPERSPGPAATGSSMEELLDLREDWDSADFMRLFVLETKMWQSTERAAIELCSQLHSDDFVLGPLLARGSLRVSCELLRLYRRRQEEATMVGSALNPVRTMWTNLVDRPLRAQVAWDEHTFALHCMRKRLPAHDADAAEEDAPVHGEQREDLVARGDLAQELCRRVSDGLLLSLREVLGHVDLSRAPPNWTALLVRALLLAERRAEAREAFAASFHRSALLQELCWRPPVVVPHAWLADVAGHPEAAKALLRLLQNFRAMEPGAFCELVEHVLLERFLPSPHCAAILLASKVMDDMVGACFSAPRKLSGSPRAERCPEQWQGQHVLQRLHLLGQRLFSAAFVAQHGFLPHVWPDCLSLDVTSRTLLDGRGSWDDSSGEDWALARLTDPPPCCTAPLVIEVSGHCLWDEGLLSIELLEPAMARGRRELQSPILHLGRQVISRHLWHGFAGRHLGMERLKYLWDLAAWPLCEDAVLIRHAAEYLKSTYRASLSCGGGWSLDAETSLFQMFAALDLSRLEGKVLLSPWVPPQVYSARLFLQQQPAEQFHAELQQEVAAATESLKSINQLCAKMSNKLNIVEHRTYINKSHLNDTSDAIEEYRRRKQQLADTKPAP